MTGPVLLDSGALVALLAADDAYHRWVVEKWTGLDEPLLTCEAVLTEACFLLARSPNGVQQLWKLFQRGGVQVGFSLVLETGAVSNLMSRYANVPMSLADACLVRMTELNDRATVLTLDSDFRIYRKNRRQSIPLIFPPA